MSTTTTDRSPAAQQPGVLALDVDHVPGGAATVAIACGTLGLFVLSFLLAPLALLFGLAAVDRGHKLAGCLALALGVAGLFTSPAFWTLFGYS